MTGAGAGSRSAATTQFKSQRDARIAGPGGRYQTQGFTTEPSVRPGYIPQTTYVGGRSVNIVFVPGFGYGYYDPYGMYMPYVYHPPLYYNPWSWLIGVIVLVLLILIIAAIARGSSNN